jgi:chromate transporter
VRYGHRRLERISRTATLGGLFLSFLSIGLTGFGGGLAVIAQIRTLTVRRRGWLTDSEFAEAFALAQSLPGTNAGNAVTYIGLRLRGIKGASVALAGFILPSTLIMIALAILYRHLRSLPDTERLFHGLNAAVVALILVTAWRVGASTLQKRWQWAIAAAACLAVAVFHATVIEAVLAAGLFGIYIDSFAERQLRRLLLITSAVTRRRKRIAARVATRRRKKRQVPQPRQDFVGGYITRALAERRMSQARSVGKFEKQALTETERADDIKEPTDSYLRSIGALALAMPFFAKLGLLLTLSAIFIRIGAVTFGGGFVIAPLIEAEVVNNYHWLTHQEFAEAFALGQITPGPVLITATFIGYRVAGTLGALVATISIFLPAFLMVIAAGSSLRRFRTNRLVQAFLLGVTPAVVGLLVAAAWSIGRAGIHTWIGLSLAGLAVFVLVRYRPNAFWVILGAGILRFVLGLFLW